MKAKTFNIVNIPKETWMYPPILVFRPDLAKAMLKYRIQRIGEAQLRAASGGYQGARLKITIEPNNVIDLQTQSLDIPGRVPTQELR